MNFDNMKLGLLPHDHSAPTLKVSDFLTGVVPEIPTKVDYFSGIQYSNYRNDEFGVCGPCSLANYRRCVTGKLLGTVMAPTQEDVFGLYKISGNPNFPRDDNGVQMRVMLSRAQTVGLGGKKCLAYAQVNPTNVQELKSCIAIFGGVLFGVDLHEAQKAQTNKGYWEYTPGTRSWGGHAVFSGKFDETIDVITWGEVVKMTPNFIKNQSSECWVVIYGEMFTNTSFLKSIDFKALRGAYKSLTGKAFPDWDIPPGAWDLV